ncbi:MAG: sigma-70 family RNA polymerase sigma factor [Acidimicrobiales bacterium]
MSRQSTDRSELDATLGRAWREHRRYVLDVALRMLGDLGEAEDVVQEAFTRLFRADVDEIDDVRAWLVTVVSRLCLDQLRSARRQRQEPFDGPTGVPTPARSTPSSAVADPADRVTLDDSVRLALQVVLARLSPAERTAFVLHDVFQLSFDDIADIVGRSPAACRQLARRARGHLHDDTDPARFTVESAEQRHVTETFITAAANGDLEALLAVLDPDVAGQADLGGTIGLLPPVVGRDRVTRGVLRFFGPGGKYGPDSDVTLLSLPTGRRPSVLALRNGQAVAVVTLTLRDGVVDHIHTIIDPVKLAPVTAALSG